MNGDPGTDSTRRGVAASLLSSVGFASMDAITKLLLASMPVNGAVLLRTVMIVVLLLAALMFAGQLRLLATDAPVATALRSLAFCATSLLIVHALQRLGLAETIAIYFICPVVTVLMASALLGERITATAIGSALLGFAGVWLILRPGTARFEWAYLLPLAAAFTGALQDILARRLRGHAHPVGLLAWAMVATLAASALLAAGEPLPMPDGGQWGLLAACVIACLVGYFFVIVSFQLAPAGLIAPLRYLNLAWAVLLGYLFWDTLPDARTWIGILLILAAGAMCVAPAFRSALRVR